MTWTPRECARHDFNAAIAADEPVRRTLGWDHGDYETATAARQQQRVRAWRQVAATAAAARETGRILQSEPDDATLDTWTALAGAHLAEIEPVEMASGDSPVETAAAPPVRRWSTMR